MNALRALCVTALCFSVMSILGCATDLVGQKADLSRVESPSGLAIHPNGRYAYVTGANFDLNYRATDGGAIYVVDLETDQVLASGSKRMGSFGTNIVLSSDARHGYTVTRDDESLVWFEISEDGSRIFCPEDDENSESLLKCRVKIGDDPTFVSLTRSYRETTQINHAGLPETKRVDFDLLMIAQLRNARVTAMTVQETPTGSLEFSHATASFVHGASEVIWIGGERFAVTGRSASNLLIMTPAIDANGQVKGLYASAGVTIPNGFDGYQGRGMTLDPSGQTLFLINQYPTSLLKIDISGLAKDDGATERAQVTQMMMLPVDMLKVVWVGDQETGYVYLTSVEQNELTVVDPRSMKIVQSLSVGAGPYDMVLQGNSLYIVNFLGENVSKFDVSDPANPVHERDFLSQSDLVAPNP